MKYFIFCFVNKPHALSSDPLLAFVDLNNSSNNLLGQFFEMRTQQQAHAGQLYQITQYLEHQQAQLNQLVQLIQQIEHKQIEVSFNFNVIKIK